MTMKPNAPLFTLALGAAFFGVLAPARAVRFTPQQMAFISSSEPGSDRDRCPRGAQGRAQCFYHFFKPDRDPNLVAPPWLDRTLDAMTRRPVWRDPDEGILNEAQLWQAPASVLYEFFEYTRRTFPPDRGGSLASLASLRRDYEDSRTRFQMALDRLYRARLGDSLGGRGRALMADFDLVLKEMNAALDGVSNQDEKQYVASVMAVATLTDDAYDILQRPPRGALPSEKGKQGTSSALPLLLSLLGLALIFVAGWNLGSMNAESIAAWTQHYLGLSRQWAQEFNRQFIQVKVQYLVLGPFLLFMLLGILTFNLSGFILLTGAGAYLGYHAPRWSLDYVRRRRGKRVEAQLMDAMILLSNALKSGLDIVQGFELVSRDLVPPISEEFGLVIKNYQLGMPFEKALYGMEERISSRLLSYVIKAIVIQRGVGGNLTKIFDRIVENIRDEGKLEEKMQSLTAQQRIQSIVVGIMPWGMVGLMFVFQPQTMAEYYFSPLGILTVLFCAVWMTIGMGIVRKLGDIEV